MILFKFDFVLYFCFYIFNICEFGNWKEILKDGNVIVATDEHGEEHIKIDFEITCNNAEDEVIEATCILITDIEEF